MAHPALSGFHPVLSAWFEAAFGSPTDVQTQAWRAIAEGAHTLVAAPTGSGKTLAALLPALDAIARAKSGFAAEDRPATNADGGRGPGVHSEEDRPSVHSGKDGSSFLSEKEGPDDRSEEDVSGERSSDEAARPGTYEPGAAARPGMYEPGAAARPVPYEPGVRLLYVTPLKALNNDIHHHVVAFAAELDAVASRLSAGRDFVWASIAAAVRTGDTPQSTRASMLKRPPDVLVTTPESLYLLLLSDRSRELLRAVSHVVVDEIHDLVPDKRGAHLSLSLERLTRWVVANGGREPQRIGVSATQKPLETAARFLAGYDRRGAERPVRIVESAMDKSYDVLVTVPDYAAPLQDRESVWLALTDRLMQLMEGKRTALVFVNNRRLSERLVLRLNERFGDGFARAHHGSVSRERRLEAERLLKSGELRCLVATSSLELGIDVGFIEIVVQIDSPQSAASGIQRIGRAGHGVGDTSVGRIVVRARSQLPEAALLAKRIRERDIEPVRMIRSPIDALAQHVVAAVAAGPTPVAELRGLIRQAAPFRDVDDARWEKLLRLLSGYFPFAKPLLDWDLRTDTLSPRRNTRLAAQTGAGTIPSSANYPVVHAESKIQVGDLEEEFVHESSVGDVFRLGAHSWMIREIRNDRVVVSETANRYSEVPFWRGDGGGRTFAVGRDVGAFVRWLRDLMFRATDPEVVDGLAAECGLDARAAAELIDLVRRQDAVSRMPDDRTIVVERYEDVTGRTHVVVHNYWGRRVNRAWLLALRETWKDALPVMPYANAKDNGIELVFREWDPALAPRLWSLTPERAERALLAAVPQSAMFAVSFRHLAETSLLLARGFSRVPTWQKRLRAEELLRASLPFVEEFPLFDAALRECMEEHLDASGLIEALRRLNDGDIEVVAFESDAPSPLAAQFALDYAGQMLYEGDAPSEELRRQLEDVSREAAAKLFGVSDEEVAERRTEPDVVEAERVRLERGGKPVDSPAALVEALKRRGDLSVPQLVGLAGADAEAWLAPLEREGRVARVELAGETRYVAGDEAATYARFPADSTATAFVLLRFIEGRIGFTADELAARYGLPLMEAERIVDVWREEGRIEPAPFAEPGSPYWTSRNVASRIVRLSLASVRGRATPVEPETWFRLLLDRHGLRRPASPDGTGAALRAALEPLQGLFLPATQWESAVLPARLPGYRKEELDLLCASGELVWLGRRAPGEKEGRIAFFFADDAHGALLLRGATAWSRASSPCAHPELFDALRRRGATFLTRLSADVGGTPSELLAKLMDLVWEGRVANDQFAPIRNFLLAKGKLHPKLGSGHGRWYAVDPTASSSQAGIDASPVDRTAASGRRREAERRDGDDRWNEDDRLNGGHRLNGMDRMSRHARKTDEGLTPDEARECALAWMRQLLRSFGAVTKDIANAYSPIGWDASLPVLKQLEEWGFVTRGFIVEGVPSLQFLERDTIAALRGWTRAGGARPSDEGAGPDAASSAPSSPSSPSSRSPQPETSPARSAATSPAGSDETSPARSAASPPRAPVAVASGANSAAHAVAVVSAADPAVPYGVALPWPDVPGADFARKPGNYLVVANGEWTYWIESNGKRIARVGSRAGSRDDAADLIPVFRQLLRRGGLKRIRIDTWNGKRAAECEEAAPFLERGAERDRGSLVLWLSALNG